MLPKPKWCESCPLYQSGMGFVPDEVIEESEVFLLAQNPGEVEEAQGKPKVGKVGQEEQAHFFPRAGLIRGRSVSLGNVLRCRYQNSNSMPTGDTLKQAVQHCARYFTPPASTKLFVAEGKYAWEFLGGVGSIKQWRGYISPRWYKGRPVLGVLHVGDIIQHEKKLYFPSQLDWRKIQRYLAGDWPIPVPPCHVWTGDSMLETWVDTAIREANIVALDTEYDPRTRVLSLLGAGYAGAPGIQIAQSFERASPYLRRLVQRVPVVFQNGFADIPVLEQNLGIKYTDYAHIEDTMLEHACLWSELPHDLEFQASLYSPYNKMKHLKHTDQYAYNWGDVVDTLAAHESHQREFRIDPLSHKVYTDQSLPLIPHLLRSMKRGLRVNKARIGPAAEEYAHKMREAERIAHAYAGWPLNIGSDDQVAHYLYEREGLQTQRHKKTKRPTIDADAIATLRQKVGPPYDPEEEERNGLTLEDALTRIEEGAHPVLEMRVVYADALQAASHYIRPCMIEKGMGIRDRLYPQFQIHAQASGRWSTVDPPMAQLPKDLRDIVTPDEGDVWIEWDWDQAELRLLAALCGDKPLLEAFTNGWDVHTLTTCDIFGLPYPPDRADPHHSPLAAEWRQAVNWEGKNDLRRTFAKRFEYRLNYGGEPKTSGDIPGAKGLGLTPRHLVQAANRLLAAHPAKAEWRQRVAKEAIETGVTRTFMGRKRILLARDAGPRKREAYNHPLQGGVRDIANVTFLQVAQAFPEMTFAFEMHDSQKWACPEGRVGVILPKVREIVEQEFYVYGTKLTIPATFHVIKPCTE